MVPILGARSVRALRILASFLRAGSLAAVLACSPALAGPPDGTVRGWLTVPAGPAIRLPPEVQVLRDAGGEPFVELPRAALPALESRGVRFREARDSWTLSVGQERFDVRRGEPDLPAGWRAGKPGDGLRPYLVKFHAPPDDGWLADLEGLGARLVQYLPAFGYLILLPAEAEGALGGRAHLEFTGEYHPAYKAAASLRDLGATDGSHVLRLIYFDAPGWEESVAAVGRRGARLVLRSEGGTSQRGLLHHAIFEDVPGRTLPAILADPRLYHAERWSPPQLEGERAAQVVAGNVTGGIPDANYYAWLGQIGADGTGVRVTVADSGFDTGNTGTLHPDLLGRVDFATVLCAFNEDIDGHGTNTASIAVGDPRATSGGTGLLDSLGFHWGGGSAPGALLHVQKVFGDNRCTPINADAGTLVLEAFLSVGAHIGSHSFTDGLGDGGAYNSQAQVWDAAVRDSDPTGTAGDQPYSIFFSAGNSGPGAGSLTSPKAAKNIVTVGATRNYRPGECPASTCGGLADDIEEIVGFSSRGPADDGRIKPDVVAPGHVAAGARSSAANYSCTCDGGGSFCCDSTGVDGAMSYSRYSGTSQAAPRAAGAAAVVFDWYENRFAAFPSPAMAKAILINSANDLKTADAPNHDEGWGQVSLRSVLQAPEGVELSDQAAVIGSTGDPAAFVTTLWLQDPARPARTTLVWTDPPGAIGCNPCLVNDLDLLVSHGASTWRGNNFTAGFSTTSPAADSLNNVEGVKVPPGEVCGSFDVKVRAQTLAGDGVPGNADGTDQDFALVVRNAGTSPGATFVKAPASSVSGGCDGDEFLDRREIVDLTVDLTNCGADVTGLSATLSVLSAPPGAGVTVSPVSAQAVGAVSAGAVAPTVWQVSLTDDPVGFCGEPVVLQVDVTDGLGGLWQDTVEVLLDGDGLTPTEDLDPADAGNSASADADWAIRSCLVSSPTTSWHMGASDCTGIPKGSGVESSLVFEYALGPGDRLDLLSFEHAFDGYDNANFQDTVTVEIDHDADGTYDALETWTSGIDNPTTMTLAGPYDLSPFDAGRAGTISVRLRFASGAGWVGPNNATGWDVDDIRLTYDVVACDPDGCPGGPAPVPAGSLTVDLSGPNVVLGWGAVAGATGYNLYGGSLGSIYSHAVIVDPLLDGGDSCQEPSTTATFATPAGDVYFLVASDDGSLESNPGSDSAGTPRPPAPTPCNPR